MGKLVYGKDQQRHAYAHKGSAVVFSYHLFQNYILFLSSMTRILEGVINSPGLSKLLK